MEKELQEEFNQDYSKYSINMRTYKDQKIIYALKTAALKELSDLILETNDNDKFLNLITKVLKIEENLCDPRELFETLNSDDLENNYYQQLGEFNRAFISQNISKIPIKNLVKFICESIAHNNISKEFIDIVKLHPDAPKKFRDKFKNNNNNKKWYDIEIPSTPEELMKEADELILGYSPNYDLAINIYDDIIEDRDNCGLDSKNHIDQEFRNKIFFRLVIILLLDNNCVSAKDNLNKYIKEYPDFYNTDEAKFLDKTIKMVEQYLGTRYFTELLNEYKDLLNDTFIVKILLILKNKIHTLIEPRN